MQEVGGNFARRKSSFFVLPALRGVEEAIEKKFAARLLSDPSNLAPPSPPPPAYHLRTTFRSLQDNFRVCLCTHTKTHRSVKEAVVQEKKTFHPLAEGVCVCVLS